ncbi:hypothetical protein [Motiliproteus sp. MSK22-1]|uniref:hypothetical protein n=1 Tax=Motiliproteus sp. MSK22-1 TaxID=1897630 RepID=UPI0009777146|nr:hypothetical protein [Motiliproteus sp. MSK22-1]OMH25865.1 hypothetical protein BGP75_25475 [Motiliproteus sp. MSK22-1]
MDLQAALTLASQHNAANVIGLQLHGRSIEVYRPRYSEGGKRCQVEYREGMLFQDPVGCDLLEKDSLPEDASQLDYFVAPLSDDELDAIIDQRGEVILHRLLEGAPNPEGCDSPRQKAAFTSWCIAALAQRNG